MKPFDHFEMRDFVDQEIMRYLVKELLNHIPGTRLLPYEEIIVNGKPEYVRRELGVEKDIIFAKVWQGDDNRFHTTFDFDAIFETADEARAYLDSMLLEHGAVFIDPKLVSMV